MAKKLKATELFLSLGLVATLATACGGPSESGETGESDVSTPTEEPTEAGKMEEPAGTPTAEPTAEPSAAPSADEGGEGGEGGEG